MKKLSRILCIAISLLLISGCGILENSLTDIDGWDLSACVSGYDTCLELFLDNSDRILGGEQVIINNLTP